MPQDPQNSKNGDPSQEQFDRHLLKGNINTMRSWAEIDLAALERNLNLIRSALPQPMKYVSVVKADAYGHGILPTAARLMQSGVDLFAVANIKEAAEIREMASGWPILVLGPLLEDEDSALLEYDLIATLSSASELPRFAALARKRKQKIKIHLKIDSGMGRLGAWWEEAGELIAETLATQEIELCGLLTHFADPRDLAFTDLQRSRFQKIHDALPAAKRENLMVHADNSSSLLNLKKDSIFNSVRIGLLQFGVSPQKESLFSKLQVEPVLSFHSKLAIIKKLPAQTTLSYGRQYQLQKSSNIGIISAGYGDAIPLHCGNRADALIRGNRYPIVGRVTMDQTLVDLTDAPDNLEVGETVTLIGKQGDQEILLTKLAEDAGTIPWELLCSITKRVPRVYTTNRE